MVKDKSIRVLERINGAKIITVALYEVSKDESNGFIDYVDERWGKARHRFAFVLYKDIEDNGHKAEDVKKLLNNALINGLRLDLVMERRQATPKQQFDWLIKVERAEFFG